MSNNEFTKISEIMTFEEIDDSKQVMLCLGIITGHKYIVATASSRMWGKKSKVVQGIFYQIMPDTMDDGFFDWYCDMRSHHQFFKTVEVAVIHFTVFWHIWKAENN